MDQILVEINSCLFESNGLFITNYNTESEGKAYGACRFEINGLKIISRNAKMTPKKMGQFVTVWKRSPQGITQPFDENDVFDLLVINIKKSQQLGQFVFPKSVLIEKGIITTSKKEGKRGFRIYPPWEIPTSKQALNSQNWQSDFFWQADDSKKDMKRLFNRI
ncbi:MAG: MepB family protein [Reichenbachiella sp.]|uniref:MepB family protein n=1 Tax=Reichenbachiella sp. TaxID=2184521 RepID=UPI003299E361